MPSIKEAFKVATVFIPALEARILLSYVLKCEVVLKDSSSLLTKKDFKQFISLVKRRVKGEPIAYITGVKEFYGIEFAVSKNVLIPRPETEILVEKSLEVILNNFPVSVKVADVCTGSGVIALTLARLIKYGEFTGFDISAGALKIAELNKKHQDASIVQFVKQDIFARNFKINADVLVSNPPYIAQKEVAKLMPDVRDFEPKIALAGGKDGLDFYKRIAEIGESCKFILVEIGESMEKNVIDIFVNKEYNFLFSAKDLAGKIRVLGFKNNSIL